jgi:SAM-dependent methyltransferase
VLRLIDRYFSGLSPSLTNWRVPDIGCGDGIHLFLIRKRLLELNPGVPSSFTGVDGNHASLRICQLKKAHYGASDCDFIRCDLSKRSLPLADGTMDFVYCSEVVEHLQEPERLFTEIRRILKPRGYFLMTTPNEPNLFQRSYWNKTRHKRERGRELSSHSAFRGEDDKGVSVFGHISIRPVKEWETCLASAKFERIDFERGALIYEMPKRLRGELFTAMRVGLEAILDALPKSWTHGISDEMIVLYRRSS